MTFCCVLFNIYFIYFIVIYDNILSTAQFGCTPHPILWVDKIEKNEMGGACDTFGGRERCAQGFGGET